MAGKKYLISYPQKFQEDNIMNKLKELSIFYSPKELWCCRTRTLNAVSGTVEYHTHTGFITQTEAEKTLEETESCFSERLEKQEDVQQLLLYFHGILGRLV